MSLQFFHVNILLLKFPQSQVWDKHGGRIPGQRVTS